MGSVIKGYQAPGSISSAPRPISSVPSWSPASGEVRGFHLATPGTAPIAGRTLELRQLGAGDYEQFAAFCARNRERIDAVSPDLPPGAREGDESPDAYEEWLEVLDELRSADREYAGIGVWRGDELIGLTGLHGVVRGALQSAQVHLAIDADHAGQDHAAEAFDLLLRLAFEDLDLHRVEAAVLPDNAAVRRALEKFGVRSEGIAPAYMRVAGEWRDHERYAITAEEWAERS